MVPEKVFSSVPLVPLASRQSETSSTLEMVQPAHAMSEKLAISCLFATPSPASLMSIIDVGRMFTDHPSDCHCGCCGHSHDKDNDRKKKEKEEKKGEKLIHSERYYGMVSRSFSLPCEVDDTATVAEFHAALLGRFARHRRTAAREGWDAFESGSGRRFAVRRRGLMRLWRADLPAAFKLMASLLIEIVPEDALAIHAPASNEFMACHAGWREKLRNEQLKSYNAMGITKLIQNTSCWLLSNSPAG